MSQTQEQMELRNLCNTHRSILKELIVEFNSAISIAEHPLMLRNESYRIMFDNGFKSLFQELCVHSNLYSKAYNQLVATYPGEPNDRIE